MHETRYTLWRLGSRHGKGFARDMSRDRFCARIPREFEFLIKYASYLWNTSLDLLLRGANLFEVNGELSQQEAETGEVHLDAKEAALVWKRQQQQQQQQERFFYRGARNPATAHQPRKQSMHQYAEQPV